MRHVTMDCLHTNLLKDIKDNDELNWDTHPDTRNQTAVVGYFNYILKWLKLGWEQNTNKYGKLVFTPKQGQVNLSGL